MGQRQFCLTLEHELLIRNYITPHLNVWLASLPKQMLVPYTCLLFNPSEDYQFDASFSRLNSGSKSIFWILWLPSNTVIYTFSYSFKEVCYRIQHEIYLALVIFVIYKIILRLTTSPILSDSKSQALRRMDPFIEAPTET